MPTIFRRTFLACLCAMAAASFIQAQSTSRAVYHSSALGFSFEYPSSFTDVSDLYVGMFGPPRTSAKSPETKFPDCLDDLFVGEDTNHNEVEIERYDLSCMGETMTDAIMDGGIRNFTDPLHTVFTGSTFSAHQPYRLATYKALLVKGTLPGKDGDLSVIISCVALNSYLVCWKITADSSSLANALAALPVTIGYESPQPLVPASLLTASTSRPAAPTNSVASSPSRTTTVTTVTHNSGLPDGTVIQSPDHFTYSFPSTFVDKTAASQAETEKARASSSQPGAKACATEQFSFQHPDPAFINIFHFDLQCMGYEPIPGTLRDLVTSIIGIAKSTSRPNAPAATFGELKSYSLGSHPAVTAMGHMYLGTKEQPTSLIITCVLNAPNANCWNIYAPWDDRAKEIAAYKVTFDGEPPTPLVPR